MSAPQPTKNGDESSRVENAGGKKRKKNNKVELTPEELEKKNQKDLWEAHVPDLFEMWANRPILYDDTHEFYHDRDRAKLARNDIVVELALYSKLTVLLRNLLPIKCA